MNVRIFLLFALVSMSDLSHALYGARPINSSDLRAVVSLHLDDPENDEYDYFCSGVLIAPDKVLTAGHCIGVMGNILNDDVFRLTGSPETVVIKSSDESVRAKSISFAPSYFDAAGFEGEDLAIIDLVRPMKNIRPLKLASIASLKAGVMMTLVARGKMATTALLSLKRYAQTRVLTTDGFQAGTCLGDSGGAMLIEKDGQYELAGILNFQGEGCEKKNSVAIFPKAQF